ncbi:TldD/PmbA family protein [Candidatus Nitrosotenuis cloacae]|uniref:TldD/PmbA family protein n=1 Tax=Candidatus Nitrosotenuis cloacae TaxID=1603555 RepID=UPI001F18ABA2|nr:TldD/PmbA family protein [Candidatus Nitrosotenuis cloacae]
MCDDVISFAQKISDESESVFCAKKTITIRITDSEIAEIKENHESSIGVRIVKDKKISSAQSTILDSKIVEQAVKNSANLARREFWEGFAGNSGTITIQKTNDPKIWSMDSTKAAEFAQIMIDHTKHQRINRISGSLNIVCDDFEIQNTSGLKKQEKSTYISGVINADSEIGIPVSGIGQASARTLDGFSPDKIGSDAAQMCVNSANPGTTEAQTISVIFEPLAVGEILYFVLGPNFALKTFSEKKSCFPKIGEKIATNDLDVLDEPHMQDSLGAKSFDEEGVPTKKTHYIKSGVFESTYTDLYNAYKEKSSSTGNACRPGIPLGRSSNPIPVSAPHNLTISPGNKSRDEIIRETKNGIIVSRLWYTYAVNPIKGDFSCTARSGIWQIQNGKITHPIKPVRIIHSLPKLLQNISGIGNNSKTVLPWAGLPITCPTIRCDGVSISLI